MEKNIEIEKGLTDIVNTSFFIFFSLILSKIFSYTYRIIIARYFGPEVYGVFTLALMILTWVVTFASFGLSDGLLRYSSFYRGKKQYEKIRYLVKYSYLVMLISSIFSAVFLFSFSEMIAVDFFHNENLTIFLKIFSFLIPVLMFSNILFSLLKSFEKVKAYSFLINILQNMFRVLFLVFFIFIGLNINSIAYSYFFSIILVFIIAYFICKYKIPELIGNVESNETIKNDLKRELFSYSWPVMFLSFFNNFIYGTDSFVIGFIKGAKDVGIYNAALPLITLFNFAQDLFIQLFFPIITKKYAEKDMDTIRELSKQVSKWIFIVELPIFLMLFLFPGAFINILFGSEYLPAQDALRVLAIGSLFSFLIPLLSQLIFMSGKSKLILKYTLFALITNLFLNIFLIKRYGLIGAAISTSFVSIFLTLALLFYVKKNLDIIPLRRKMINILLVSLIPLIGLLIIKSIIPMNLINLIITGSLFLIFYLFLIFITKCFDKNDLLIIKSFKQKIILFSNNED
ncbi:MAG TPA: flippase [Candidatus Paceibacterota bacterium]|nr:flippase [Candidatus Paceibacterota bacterium]